MTPAEALDEISARVRAATAASRPLSIVGGGTKSFLGGEARGEPLPMGMLAGIIDYDPAELVVSVRAGTALAELERVLAAAGQMLPFEPPRFEGASTIGGAVAAGLAGPRRASAGAVRDFVLGAVLVSATGAPLRFGGRVMKNVAGFDVSRLLCGSLGILGPIVELSLKVLPAPALEETLVFEQDAATAISHFNAWMRRPLPVSATAWWQGRAWLRLSGSVAAVEAARTALGGERLAAAEADALWSTIRDHRHVHLAPRTPLWRITVPATTAPLALEGTTLVEWAGGLRWLRSSADGATIRRAARAAGGSAVLWHGPAGEPASDPLPPPVLAIHRRLKAAFDPAGIFNPGRFVAEL